MKFETIHKGITLLGGLQMVVMAIFWISICWISIEAILYVNEHGLKHLIDVIWLGK